MAKGTRKPFHEKVAERIIAQLKEGTAPWQKPWDAQGFSPLPTNPTTGKRYRGVNAINLSSQGYTDNRWLTYKQAASVGAQIRKGESGTPVQYWQYEEMRAVRDDQGKAVMDAEGNTLTQRVELERPRAFYAIVFNAEQIDGLPALAPLEKPSWVPTERAEAILANSGVQIIEQFGDRAFYRPAADTIVLPERGQFASSDRFYSVALHELGHATGHPTRLDRDLDHPFGSVGYAKEELRAEIASLLIGEEIRIGHDAGQHAAYVASWVKILEDDPLEIVRACADAEKILTHVMALEHKQALRLEAEVMLDRPVAIASQSNEVQKGMGNQAEIGSGRTYLAVPYGERHEAKAAGARWDAGARSWYVGGGHDLGGVAKWLKVDESHGIEGGSENAQEAALPVKSEVAEAGVDHGEEVPARGASKQEAPKRIFLAVPYTEKNEAKAAGARWDKAAKCWYINEGMADKASRWLLDAAKPRQESPLSPYEGFADAMRSAGLTVPAGHPIMDGSHQRVPTVDDKGKERSGFYFAYANEAVPAGYIMNNRTQEEIRWRAQGVVLTPEERAQALAAMAQAKEQRAVEQQAVFEKTAQRVQTQIEGCHQITGALPYHSAKGIEPTKGALTDKKGETIFLPAIDTAGKHWTTQYINSDGSKVFSKDSTKEGHFHVVNGGVSPRDALAALDKAPVIIIGEGYATAAVLSEAVGYATVVGFDAGNLPAVAEELRARYPDKPFVIAADDDQRVVEKYNRNPGLDKGALAAEVARGAMIAPVFAPGEQEGDKKSFTDFNDLAVRSSLGREAVLRQLEVGIDRASKMQSEWMNERHRVQENSREQGHVQDDEAQQKVAMRR